MSLRIGTNLASLSVQSAMGRTQQESERSLKNLASGSRLADPSADVASLGISEQIRSEIQSLGAARLNSQAAVSFVSIAEGAMAEQSNIITRMRELAIQASSDNYSDTEREFMNREYTELRDELDRIAKTTHFGATNLLDGTQKTFEFQVGSTGGSESRISFESEANTTASGLGVDGSVISERSDARDSLSDLDEALKSISGQRARFGATQSRLESASNNLDVNIENLSAARSTLADADVAKEVSNIRRTQILQQYQASVLREANSTAVLALNLLG